MGKDEGAERLPHILLQKAYAVGVLPGFLKDGVPLQSGEDGRIIPVEVEVPPPDGFKLGSSRLIEGQAVAAYPKAEQAAVSNPLPPAVRQGRKAKALAAVQGIGQRKMLYRKKEEILPLLPDF